MDDFKQKIIGNFELVANGYDCAAQRYFVFAADNMVELVKTKSGDKVLDVATGTGHVAIAAAQWVQPGGRVHAVDLSANMLAQARTKAEHLAIDNIDFFQMDAEELEFKSNYYDIITCGFGLFFVGEILTTLRGWQRVLKPVGRVVFTSFTTNAFQPFIGMFGTMIESFGVAIDSERFGRLNDIEKCEAVLKDAGFSNVETRIKQLGFHLKDENDWWEIVEHSGLRGFIEQLGSGHLAEFKEKHLADIANYKTEKGIWLDVEVIFAMGVSV